MSPASDYESELAAFPAPLRTLIAAELEAGNAIAELGHSFPAAPCGAYVLFAHPVTTRPRAATPELGFYDRNCSLYSGEFYDAHRHFFALEPPRPPEPEPDMNALRDRLAARIQDSPAHSPDSIDRALEARPLEPIGASPLLDAFRSSMEMDYEKWREGTGFAIELIPEATADERATIESILIHRRPYDWRTIQALAALDTPKARTALISAMQDGDAAVRMAVHRYAPELISQRQRTHSLVAALATAEFYGGLTQALSEAAAFHPPEVEQALWQGVREREGGIATHFAALLCYLHGKAKSPFDWDLRPFFLRFNTADPAARRAAEAELRALVADNSA